MNEATAREYSESLGQIFDGGFRQAAWADKQKVPQAMGMTMRDWVNRYLGGYVRMTVEQRKAAVLELAAEGMSNNGIARALGMDNRTVGAVIDDAPIPHRYPEPTASPSVQPEEPAASPSVQTEAPPARPTKAPRTEWDKVVDRALSVHADGDLAIAALTRELSLDVVYAHDIQQVIDHLEIDQQRIGEWLATFRAMLQPASKRVAKDVTPVKEIA